MQQFIKKLLDFVDKEYDTQNEQILAVWARPIDERVSLGEAIKDITIEKASSSKLILNCKRNLSKFRKGSRLRLHKGNPQENGNYFCCEVIEDRGNILIIEAGWQVDFNKIDSKYNWLLDKDLIDLRRFPKAALNQLIYNPVENKKICKILQGHLKPKTSKPTLSILESRMNRKQREAFENAISTDSYYMIQGPPGTGKTFVLAHIAKTLVNRGEKVLVTAFTHTAINNALKKISKETGLERIAKIGQNTRAGDLDGIVKNYERLSNSPYDDSSKGVVLGGTCFAVRSSRLQNIEFDTVIFDEASQLSIPLAISGMLSANRYIFIGDEQQMSPIVLAEHEESFVSKSIFEYLKTFSQGTMLNVTYRMNFDINKFPSLAFYEGRLRPDYSNFDSRLILSKQPRVFQEIINPEKSDIFFDLRHSESTIKSELEADKIVQIISELLYCGVSSEEIAVIAPYRAQGRLIRKKIRKILGENRESDIKNIVVDTVERIQGQERDVILISLTTSDPAHASQLANFYFKPNRLNVAITRAKKKRIVVGSSFLLAAEGENEILNTWIEIFRQFYYSSHTVFFSKDSSKISQSFLKVS